MKINVKRKYKDVKLETEEEQDEFESSLEFLQMYFDCSDKKEKQEYLKKAKQECFINPEVEALLILNDDNLSQRSKRKKLESLVTTTFKGDLGHIQPYERLNNELFVTTLEYLSTFFLKNNMFLNILAIYNDVYKDVQKLPNSKILIKNFVKAALSADIYEIYDAIYKKIPAKIQRDEFILLSNLLFSLRLKDDEKARDNILKLKESNKYAEMFCDSYSAIPLEKPSNVNVNEWEEIEESFDELDIFIGNEYMLSSFVVINEEVRIEDLELPEVDYDEILKTEEDRVEEMLSEEIFYGLNLRFIKILAKYRLCKKEDFEKVYSEKLVEVEGIGPKTITILRQNGVVFKEDIE